MDDWTTDFLTLIEDCEAREERLTDWERGFIDGLRAQIVDGKRPTDKQSDRLDEIWNRATTRR